MPCERCDVKRGGQKKMKYDFTSVIDRRGKDALAGDIPADSEPFQDGTG